MVIPSCMGSLCTRARERATVLYAGREICLTHVWSSRYVATNSVTELAFSDFAGTRLVRSIGSSFNATLSEEVPMALQSPFFNKREENTNVRGTVTSPNAAAASGHTGIVAATAAPATPAANTAPGKEGESKLTVGPNIKLKGVEITDCDTLVVEGSVEATMDSRVIQISER